MFIEYEETPNPHSLKLLPGRVLMDHGTAEFKNREEAESAPLAARLFEIDGVTNVFVARDFVSVSKSESRDWDEMKARIMAVMMEHLSAGLPVVHADAAQDTPEDDSEIGRQVRDILESHIKPAVAMDGGNIEYVRFDDGVVYLRLEGACAGCPSASATLKQGIEGLLKHYVPEVIRVEAAS